MAKGVLGRGELAPSTVFADRFMLDRVAGSGGMGVVYRARDRKRDGATVALKVLHLFDGHRYFQERFAREAYMLSELRHPGIVAYIDHGITPQGQPFLVMEWLDGEDLGDYLHHHSLTLGETVKLFCGVADALSAAHRRGFVHRDLKPENIFLRDGSTDSPTLLDFGAARLVASDLTAAGIAVGTPLYMAPEQARGARDVGPSVDVFALGCVMYKCLTGRTPVANGHPTVVLASILLNDFPPLRTLRPATPEKVELLLERMLAKEPSRRPKDAHALLEELLALGSLLDEPAPRRSRSGSQPMPLVDELQLVSVIFVVEERSADAPGLPDESDESGVPSQRSQRRALGDTVHTLFGARVEVLRDGSMVATLAQTEHMTATDQAVQAARCALFLREQLGAPPPSRRILITTGRSKVVGKYVPSVEMFDCASTLLNRSSGPLQIDLDDSLIDIRLDEITALLLDARFEMRQTDSGTFVLDSELTTDEARPLLGKPTPCVGRDRELTQLQLLLDECCEDSVARVAVVIAPPGIGKSRLRQEFVRYARRNQATGVWFGRTDPTRAGTPYGLLADTLWRLIEMREGEELPVQQTKLRARAWRHVPAHEAEFVTEFLAELCRVPFPSDKSPTLRLARSDPRTMVAQVTAAFVSFLKAECDVHPVLIVLEDLHWGDGLTMRVIDAALRDCRDKPVMVLALARPEVDDRYPKFWNERKRQDLYLDGLSKRASVELITRVLGPDVSQQLVTRIAEQAAGNALFLEELIRFVAERGSDEMPDTVLAMLQARLQRLTPELRRVLRAASVYGTTFWRGGVLALLGTDRVSASNIDEWLDELLQRELITQSNTSRLLGDTEYAFRHALVREAAHSLLTNEDREAGHRSAAAFLESMGEREPHVLAEHYALANEMGQAAGLYALAAGKALDYVNLREAIQLAQRGIACGPQGALLGILLGTQARALMWECDYVKAYECVHEALTLLRRGSAPWCHAVGTMIAAVGAPLNRYEEMLFWGNTLRAMDPEPGTAGLYVESLRLVTAMLTFLGRRAQVQTYLARIDDVTGTTDNVLVRGLREYSHAHVAWFLSRDPWAASLAAARAEDLLEMANSRRSVTFARIYRGASLAHLGSVDTREPQFRAALEDALQDGDRWTSGVATTMLAMTLVDKETPEAIHEAEPMVRSFVADHHAGDQDLKGFANAILAQILLDRGEVESAERHILKALGMLTYLVVAHPYADAARVKILLRAEKVAEACAYADGALARLEQRGGGGFHEVRLRFAAFEAYDKAGDPAAAQLLEKTIQQIAIRAAAIDDRDARTRFLTRNAINRRVLEVARKRFSRGNFDSLSGYI
ncbi:protein kinase [Pendulispora rubella]|uniref:Protein kinase n=1 Tax=Pendulispora rubella TaxID=2741070 RepID=A0ABZ2KT83_9BACT